MRKEYFVIGVMSGTSLDGIDMAAVNFVHINDKWTFEIRCAETVPYSYEWKERIKYAIGSSNAEVDALDFDYTRKLSDEILAFISRNNLYDIDAICSHGHTIFHEPEKGRTLQIGNDPLLASLLKLPVVCDFRVDDVALGGQGAPLVPIGDRLLFSEYDACLNLGGIANISFEIRNSRIAYDICPANIVLNRLASRLGEEFDKDGLHARQGEVDSSLLSKLNALPFYQKEPPKSLGLEWVEAQVFPLIQNSGLDVRDALRTFIEHIVIQLTQNFKTGMRILITGGGAYNQFLMEQLKKHADAQISVPEKITVEYKEALIFGLLGILKLRGDVNVLASVTGALHDHSSGRIYGP